MIATNRKPNVKIQVIAATILLFASTLPLFGQDEPKTAYSPDNTMFAAVRSIPSVDYIWKTDMDGFRLVVVRSKADGELGDVYFKDDVATLAVEKFQWSPDSKFLVMTTVSTDGHAPSQFTTFVFSVADKCLRRVDDLSGAPVASADFYLEAPSTAVMRVWNEIHKPGNPDDSKTVKVSLQQTFAKMQKLN